MEGFMEFNLSKTQQKFCIGFSFVMLVGTGLYWYRQQSSEDSEQALAISPDREAIVRPVQSHGIKVHIGGAVLYPGVYEVSPNQRVMDVLTLAGGLTAGAKLDGVNLAQKLKDGQRIVVPFLPDKKRETHAGQIDLNSASVEQIKEIPGVGPALAKRIVEARQKWGGFRTWEDIKKIKGLGGKKGDEIKPYVTL